MEKHRYQEILHNEYLKHKSLNGSYSLRAFSRDLELIPSHLTRVLKGERNISLETAERISEKLFKKKKEREYFKNLVRYSIAKTESVKRDALNKITKYEKIYNKVIMNFDIVNSISNWFYVTLLELVTLKGERQTVQNFSKRLGISKKEVIEVIDRLLRLGLLQNKKGVLTKTNSYLKSPTGIPNDALKSFHRQMIKKAEESIEDQGLNERYITSKTLSFSAKDMNKIIQLIEEFKSNVDEVLESSSSNADSVYQINVQFFNLLKCNKQGSKNEKNI